MIYISGKITGDSNFREKFNQAKDLIMQQHPNEDIINPADITLPECCGWQDYMDVCLMLMNKADTIYLLNDWRDSKGACLEYGYAKGRDMIILFNEDGVRYEK